jgi:drug/metabolite transporter, DME family
VGAALVLGAASLWATFGIFARHLYGAGFQPLELASARAAVGFVAVALFAIPRLAAAGGRGGIAVGWRALPFLAAYGALGYALFTLVFFRSLELLEVPVAVALLYTAPAFVMLASAVLWKESVGGVRGLALGLVLAGVLLVTGAAGALFRGTAPIPAGALLPGLAAGATYAGYTLFSRVATVRYGAVASLFWSFGFGTLALALLAPPWQPFTAGREHWPVLLALGIVPTLLPYALFLAALRQLRASTASMLAALEPVVAAGLAALFLGERLGPLQGAGVLLVVAAAVLLARQVAGGGQAPGKTN